jgi:hypothetical protein
MSDTSILIFGLFVLGFVLAATIVLTIGTSHDRSDQDRR